MITYHRRALLAAPLAAASSRRARAAAPIQVVASFSILADFVRVLGGDAVAVTALVPPDADPHGFQPRPSDLARLQRADVMVENGLGLEGWLARLVQAAGFQGVRCIASAGITPRPMTEDGRTVPDPHIWQNPLLAAQMVRTIAATIPGAAGRAEAFIGQITALDREVAARIAAIPANRRQVITTHDAFGYYGARYGISFRAPLGISTEAEPSPRALARLAAQIRQAGMKTVFLENMTNPGLAASLAREAGAAVGPKLYSDSLSPPDGPAPTYLDLIRYNTAQLVKAMTS